MKITPSKCHNVRAGIATAWRTSSNTPNLFFHFGYQGITLPRLIRRLIVKSQCHRAWLSGYTGGWLGSISERSQVLASNTMS